jgi:hypothetical protein
MWLTLEWRNYIGVKDASSHGVSHIIIGENIFFACSGQRKTSHVPSYQKPTPRSPSTTLTLKDASSHGISRIIIRKNIFLLAVARGRHHTCLGSDLELAGLLLLWMVMEEMTLNGAHVALFRDNSPMVHWVERMAARHSHALAL